MAYIRRPDDILRYIGQAHGKDFENLFCHTLGETYKSSKNYNVQSYTGTRIDTEQGTDAIFNDGHSKIRLDPTLNFYHKNYMPYIADSNIKCGNKTLWFGIRHGNHHNGEYHPFPEPVVVVGLNAEPKEYNEDFFIIESDLKNNMTDIITFAYDCLEDYNATVVTERQELFSTPLRKNPDYRPPKKNIKERYAKIEQWRDEVLDEKGQVKEGYIPTGG